MRYAVRQNHPSSTDLSLPPEPGATTKQASQGTGSRFNCLLHHHLLKEHKCQAPELFPFRLCSRAIAALLCSKKDFVCQGYAGCNAGDFLCPSRLLHLDPLHGAVELFVWFFFGHCVRVAPCLHGYRVQIGVTAPCFLQPHSLQGSSSLSLFLFVCVCLRACVRACVSLYCPLARSTTAISAPL